MASVLQVATIKDQGGNANAIEIANSSANVTINNLAGGAIGSAVTGFTGIKVYDNWRITANTSPDASSPISANLERNDTANVGFIGSPMSVSSGIWTFPMTGIYLIGFNAQFYLNGSAQYIGTTIDSVVNGSATRLTISYTYVNRTNTASTYTSSFQQIAYDVPDTSTHKLRFFYLESSSGSANLWGSTNYTGTQFTFMRIGDT